ncbi:MAG: hypothetical protein IT392_04445 [Nitrospirae bacterium]|nr:hypothetical protein [Nitrospirota bacterium]
MLLPLDVNVNCRVRRDAGETDIVSRDNNQTDSNTTDNYKSGSSFEEGMLI